MHRSVSGLLATVLIAAVAVALVAAAGSKPTAAEAEAAAVRWLAGLGDRGLVIMEQDGATPFVVSHGDSAVGRVTRFEFRRDDLWATFTFRGAHAATTPIDTLRRSFWHAALDRLPTPGLAPEGWRVRPLTPTSSFAEGVEIDAPGDGRIRFHVRTRCFALDGRDPDVAVPADAPAPPQAFFRVRRDFPLDLALEAPIEWP